MNKIIEIFKWGYEGEYYQYFYVVDDEEETEFIAQANEYLKTKQNKKEFFWSEPLHKFKPHKQVSIIFSPYSHINHLKGFYVIEEQGETKQKIILNYMER